MKEVAFYVAGHALRSKFLDGEGKVLRHLFPQVLRITQEWIDGHFVVQGRAAEAAAALARLRRRGGEPDLQCLRADARR